MGIEFTFTPERADIDFLTQKINDETPQFGSAYPFSFFLRDKHNHIVAGCNGSVVYGAIYTDQLWVDPRHRNGGLGRVLMERVHDYGREVGCTMATVVTMSFQGAQSFYEKLGYSIDFKREGYVNGSSLLCLKKVLST
jgi:GNAT superfamily N-acetyltransferase